MFSRLEPLFKNTFRKAESTDTRQAIRREDKKDGRRKNHDKESETADSELWKDSTYVSVEALKAFLSAFLEQQIKDERDEAQSQPSSNSQSRQSATTRGYKAAQAYQNMADKAAQPVQEKPESRRTDAVESEDVRIMNKLIDDLNTLSGKGVTDLNIQKEGTFLESLKSAVQKAMSS